MSFAGQAIMGDDLVTITTTLVQVRSVSYPVNGIGCVLVKPPKPWGYLIIAVLFLLSGMPSLFQEGGC